MDQKSSLLKGAGRILQKNPAGLLGAAAWPYLGVFVAAAIARVLILRYASLDDSPMEPLALWNSVGSLAKVGIILSYFFYTSVAQGLALAGVSAMTWESCLGGNTTFLHGFLEVRGRFLRVIALSFLVGFWTTLLASVVPVVGPFVVQTIFLPNAVVLLMVEKPPLGVLEAFRRSLGLMGGSLATILAVAVLSAATFAGLIAVLIRLRISTSVSPVFFTFATLVSFILVLPPAVALILGVMLTSSYYGRRFRATEAGVLA